MAATAQVFDQLGWSDYGAITFVIVRIAFWLGYRIKPVYRAFGFASTAYMNLAMLVASLWLWVR